MLGMRFITMGKGGDGSVKADHELLTVDAN